MKKLNIFHKATSIVMLGVALWSSCTHEDFHPASSEHIVEVSSSCSETKQDFRNVLPGRLIIKLKPGNTLRSLNQEDKPSSRPDISQHILKTLDVVEVQPLFADYPEFRARRRKAGLDRWFVIKYDKPILPQQAAEVLLESGGFEYVEMQYAQFNPTPKITPSSFVDTSQLRNLSPKDKEELPFDDPLLPLQWHYHNNGIGKRGARAGADINLFPAWHLASGKRPVVVCVVDEGVDYKHEDLAENFDLERSYNFVYDSKGNFKGQNIYHTIGHATHVAGTIGAVNGNGKGVCGIAGGDGSPDSGITLINAQIFGRPNEEAAPGAAGIVWGADHGAVISQNSWGYRLPGPRETPQHDKEAIDYFIANAGKAADGSQAPDSPMAGGIVIFAAGNDGHTYRAFPGAYEKCISVSSMAWDFSRAVYSNSGSWISIMAPGGDQGFGEKAGILSTLPTSVDRSGYGYMEGTSMACPHVSGVAALTVSRLGGPGFTNEMLKERLLCALRPFDINKYNPTYSHLLGVGYIDALLAVSSKPSTSPDIPVGLKGDSSYHSLSLSWEVSAHKGTHIGIAPYYDVYIDTKPIDPRSSQTSTPTRIYSEGKKLGARMTHEIKGLKDNTEYHIAVVAVDHFGQKSQPSMTTLTTRPNHAPAIVSGRLEATLLLSSMKRQVIDWEIEDKDGHRWDWRLVEAPKGVSISRQNNTLSISIEPIGSPQEYDIVIGLKDEFGKEVMEHLSYRLIKYQPVRVSQSLREVVLNASRKSPLKIDLSSLVSSTEGASLSYTVQNEKKSLLFIQQEGSTIIVKPAGKDTGIGTAKVSVTDGFSTCEFRLQFKLIK